MENHQSSSTKVFLLGDSHVKFLHRPIQTPLYYLITRAIPGLKWIDYYDEKLSVYALLSLPEIQTTLSQASAIVFVVGTDSVRIMPATKIISQVEQIVLLIKQNYPNLNQSGKISISLTFPCFKTTRRFPTETSLMSNINLYNEKLKLLSSAMDFNILDFRITNTHLANDNMHIQSDFNNYILNSIINHLDQAIQPPPRPLPSLPTPPATTTTTTTADAIPSSSSSSSALDKEKSSKQSKRSREALNRRNKKNQQKMKIKQKQHKIIRKIHHQWTISQMKGYLDSLNIRYARIQSITNSILRLLFYDPDDQEFADSHLGSDEFNENSYNEFLHNYPS